MGPQGDKIENADSNDAKCDATKIENTNQTRFKALSRLFSTLTCDSKVQDSLTS